MKTLIVALALVFTLSFTATPSHAGYMCDVAGQYGWRVHGYNLLCIAEIIDEIVWGGDGDDIGGSGDIDDVGGKKYRYTYHRGDGEDINTRR